MALFGFRKIEERCDRERAMKKREKPAQARSSRDNRRLKEAEKVAIEAPASALKKFAPAPMDANYASVLVRPRITEKATFATEKGAYIFDVACSATKVQIKEAVTHYYKVTPRKVNIVTVPQKLVQSRFRGRHGVVSGGKKAYVYLKDGDSIEVV